MKQRIDAHGAHLFVVEVGGKRMGAFTECTMPTLEIETEEIKEGGQNYYSHFLPGARKGGKLTLKRGFGRGHDLLNWYLQVLQGQVKSATKPVSIILMDQKKKQLGRWDFDRAYPVKWTGPSLKSESIAIAIEELELVVHDLILA